MLPLSLSLPSSGVYTKEKQEEKISRNRGDRVVEKENPRTKKVSIYCLKCNRTVLVPQYHADYMREYYGSCTECMKKSEKERAARQKKQAECIDESIIVG